MPKEKVSAEGIALAVVFSAFLLLSTFAPTTRAMASGVYKYTDLTSQQGNVQAWISQTVFGMGNNYQGYVTVGGDGFNGYIPGDSDTYGQHLYTGYLTGAAWDGSRYLLVGERYTPGGGVYMFLYNPVRDTYQNLSSLFPSYLSDKGSMASLLSVYWDGSHFIILGDFQAAPFVVFNVLYSYNPATNTLNDLTNQLPYPDFQVCSPCWFGGFGGVQQMAYSPRGTFLLLDTVSGSKLGLLRGTTFTDLTYLLPTGFWESSNLGGPSQNMVWAKGSLWIAGCVYGNCGVLLEYNTYTGKMIDHTSILTYYSPLDITYLTTGRGLLYIAGSDSLGPSLNSWNFVSPSVTSMSYLRPLNSQVDSVAVGGTSIFVTTGYFGYLEYGILTLSH